MQTEHSRHRCGRWLSLLATLLVCFAGVSAHAQSSGMDPLLEATLQLKIQAYDHNLNARIKRGFVIAVLYSSGSKASKASATTIRDAFVRASETHRIKSIKPTVVTIEVDPAKLVETLRKQQVSMIYVAAGLGDAVESITAASKQLKIPTATNVRELVTAGIAIGIIVDRNKPKIIINLKAVVAAGMELDAEMLGLAQVLR